MVKAFALTADQVSKKRVEPKSQRSSYHLEPESTMRGYDKDP